MDIENKTFIPDVKIIHFCSHSGATLSLTALSLLVPPLRLVSAAVWQTIQQKVVADYGMLEEFVSMVTDILPELLNSRQRTELSLGLRARVSLSTSANEVIVDLMDLYFFAFFVLYVDKSFARLLFSHSLVTSFMRTGAFPTSNSWLLFHHSGCQLVLGHLIGWPSLLLLHPSFWEPHTKIPSDHLLCVSEDMVATVNIVTLGLCSPKSRFPLI